MTSTLFGTRTATPWLRDHFGPLGLSFGPHNPPEYRHVYRTLGAYVDYATRINYGPLWTHICCGLGLISGAINPDIRIPDGGREIDGRLYMAIVGPSGSGKSTMIEIARRVLRRSQLAYLLTSTPTSPQGFIKHFLGNMGRNERAFIIDSDWTGWLQEGRAGGTTRQMRPALLKFYDREGHDYSSLSAGVCVAQDPKISMLVGVPTPAWQENFTEGDITGGLLSRFTVSYQTVEDTNISRRPRPRTRVAVDEGAELAIARRLMNLHRAEGSVYIPPHLEALHAQLMEFAESARRAEKLTRRTEAGAVRMASTYLKLIVLLATDRATGNFDVQGDKENVQPLPLGPIAVEERDLRLAYGLAQIFTDSAILSLRSVATSGEEIYMQRVRDAIEKFAQKDEAGNRIGGCWVPLSVILDEAQFPERANPANILKLMVEMTQEVRFTSKTLGGVTEKCYAFARDVFEAQGKQRDLPAHPSRIQLLAEEASLELARRASAAQQSSAAPPVVGDAPEPRVAETIPMVNNAANYYWSSGEPDPGVLILGPDGFPI